VLAPNALAAGATNVFTLTLTNAANASSSALPLSSSSASVRVSIHPNPHGGACAVAPTSGVVLQTVFAFRCDGWTSGASAANDAAAALTYSWRLLGDSEVTLQSEQVCDAGFFKSAFNHFCVSCLTIHVSILSLYQTHQSVPSTSMMLPPGAPTLVEVQIRDAWGGVTAVRLAVNVSAFDLSDASANANAVGAITKTALDSLAQATSVGSMDAAAQVSVFVCEQTFA
jgi:hypothetical protein